MTQAHQARDQQTVQAQRIITALLAALPAIEERRPWAVHFQTLLHQRSHRERPV